MSALSFPSIWCFMFSYLYLVGLITHRSLLPLLLCSWGLIPFKIQPSPVPEEGEVMGSTHRPKGDFESAGRSTFSMLPCFVVFSSTLQHDKVATMLLEISPTFVTFGVHFKTYITTDTVPGSNAGYIHHQRTFGPNK